MTTLTSLMRFGGRFFSSKRFFSASRNLRNSVKDVVESKPPSQPATKPVKDVVIFRFEDPKFFKFLNLFALTQFGFWVVLSTTSLSMINTPVSEDKSQSGDNIEKEKTQPAEDVPIWRKINLGSDKYKYGLCIGSFLMGYGILFVSWTYIIRSVRYLVLRKDMKTVAFVTYGPFGKNRIMDVPVNCISAAGSRFSDTSQMPVKVKGKHLFYILDLKKGEFPQPRLFDQTVGLKRKM